MRVPTMFRLRPACLVALGLTLAATAACKKQNAYVPPPPPQVGVAKPLQQEVLPYLESTGNAVAYNQVDLEARVQGFLQEIDYKDGAAAKQGDTLFVIEPAPYQAQLQQAQATLAATQADLMQAQAEYHAAIHAGQERLRVAVRGRSGARQARFATRPRS